MSETFPNIILGDHEGNATFVIESYDDGTQIDLWVELYEFEIDGKFRSIPELYEFGITDVDIQRAEETTRAALWDRR